MGRISPGGTHRSLRAPPPEVADPQSPKPLASELGVRQVRRFKYLPASWNHSPGQHEAQEPGGRYGWLGHQGTAIDLRAKTLDSWYPAALPRCLDTSYLEKRPCDPAPIGQSLDVAPTSAQLKSRSRPGHKGFNQSTICKMKSRFPVLQAAGRPERA